MLRFAISVALGAIFLALFAPDLVSAIVPNRAAPVVAPAPPAAEARFARSPAMSAQVAIGADARGQYSVEAFINGQSVAMMVDTGATLVVLSYATAQKLGLQVLESDFTAGVQTANGVARVAPVTLRDVSIGSITLSGVQALVADRNAGPMNLLGESFLRRLASVEQRSGQLVLRR